MLAVRSRKDAGDIIPAMFFGAAVAMIFTQIAGYAATMIDGIITIRTLGADAYSGVSLLGPFTGLVLLFGGFISTGEQVVCSSLVGGGRKDEANAVFSLSVLFALIVSGLLLFACTTFPRELLLICGVSVGKQPDLYPHMTSYLRGYMTGIPAMLVILVIGPMIVMDNGKRLFTLSAFLLCAVDVAGDLLNVFVFHGGTFGMGTASAAAFYLQLLFLLTHFLNKNCYFHLSLRTFSPKILPELFKAGSPTFVLKAATTLRDLLVNRINLAVALTTAAVAARGIQNDLNTMLFCIGLGIGKTMITMTGVYYGADDRSGLTKLFAYCMRLSVIISGGVSLVAFAAAPALARLYTGDPAVLSLSVFSIRCMALGFVLDTVSVVFQNYLQGIKNQRLVNVMNFGDRLFIPVGTAFVMGLLWGSKGIMASIAVGKLILVLLLFGALCFRCRRIPRKWDDYMLLPEGFGGAPSDNLYASISTAEDVVRESRHAEEFCMAHGSGEKKAKYMGLFVEELAGNILSHGKPQGRRHVNVDYRLFVSGNRICLSLRDFCEKFDPTACYAAHSGDNPEENIGIRMVGKMAKEFRYFNAFNSNNILVYLD